MSEAQTFTRAIRPILVMNFIVGLGCIVYRSKAWSRLIGIAYTTSYVLFIIYKYFQANVHLSTQEPQLQSGLYVARIIGKCCYYLGGILAILLIIVTRLKSEKLLTVTKMIENCDRKIVRMGLPKCYGSLYKFQVYALTSIVLLITMISVCEYFQQFENLPMPVIMKLNIIFIQSFMWIISEIAGISFHVFARYVIIRFRQLNDLLRDMLNSTSQLSEHKGETATVFDFETKTCNYIRNDGYCGSSRNLNTMKAIKQIHLELIKIVRLVNNLYGMQLGLIVAVTFVFVTCLCYTYYHLIWVQGSFMELIDDALIAFFWIFFFAAKLCILSYVCNTAVDAATETGYIICELYGPWTTNEFRAEIRDFTLLLIQNPPVFTACGLFTMNRSFLQNVTRALVAYLVVLIQVGGTTKNKFTVGIYNVSTPATM